MYTYSENVLTNCDQSTTGNLRHSAKTMAAHINYLIAADFAAEGKADKLTVVGIFDKLKLPEGRPVSLLQFYVAGRLDDVPAGDATVKIELLAPDNSPAKEAQIAVSNFLGGNVNLLAVLPVVEFAKVGAYKLIVSLNGTEIGRRDPFITTISA